MTPTDPMQGNEIRLVRWAMSPKCYRCLSLMWTKEDDGLLYNNGHLGYLAYCDKCNKIDFIKN